jgi:hypothetical protein
MDLFEKKGIMILIAFSLLVSCGKDTPADPCLGKHEIKAGFHYVNLSPRLIYWMKPYWINYDWTTCYTGGATWEIDSGLVYDSLEWHIGSEIIKNETAIYRTDFPDNSDIPITLIVWGKPNKQCFPNDNGIDTLTKVYHFTSRKDRLIGTFRGAFTDVPGHKDTFEFRIFYDPNNKETVVDTFPFTSCRNYIELSNDDINEDFGWYFSKQCSSTDPKYFIGTFYIRYLDNYSNQMEVLINSPYTDTTDPQYKGIRPMHFRGYKKQ